MTELQNNKSSARLWSGIGVFLFIVSFGFGFIFGQNFDFKKTSVDDNKQVEITKIIDLYSKTRSSDVEFDQFWNVWDKIKQKYVEQPVDDTKLFYGAIQGMVSGLGDPYSVYFPPKQAQEFVKDLSGEFEGIGAEIGLKEKQITIIAPLPKSPAELAGLKAGDKIFAINKEETAKMTLEEAVSKIRGPKGTEVVLTISHDGLNKIQEIKIIRAKINVPTVSWSLKENNIAYLRISYFNETTGNEFEKSVKEIVAKRPDSLILDLRSNPGGFLEIAVDVASEWVEKGIILKEKYSNGKEDQYDTHGQHRFLNLKTVVLVDEGTASGSEIVAGALQDYGLAKIIGIKTYGKGSVQDFEVLPDGSALKVTIAKWYTPKDRSINKEGITPDVVLEKMVEEIKDKDGNVTYKDLGLEKALQSLKD